MGKENGASDEEIYPSVLMAMTTCGHPKATAGWKWVNAAIEGA
jgi:alkylhydroperoxidase/carboxymuconolactone decarboxylase family protein YurZ